MRALTPLPWLSTLLAEITAPQRLLALGASALLTFAATGAPGAPRALACIDGPACLAPAATLLEPAADTCLGAEPALFGVAIADPAGGVYSAAVRVGGVLIGQTSAAVPPSVEPVELWVPLESIRAPEGDQPLSVQVRNDRGWSTELGSGAAITVDRTPPTITLTGPTPDTCVSPHLAQAGWTVTDDQDPAPRVTAQRAEDGCEQTLRVVATDACGNTAETLGTYLRAGPPPITVEGVAPGAAVWEARLTWSVEGAPACVTHLFATLTHTQSGRTTRYTEGSPITEHGDYVFELRAADCQGVAWPTTLTFTVGPRLTPPELTGWTGNGNLLLWDSTAFGHEGFELQRRSADLFETPARGPAVGVAAPYYHEGTLRSLLTPSAQRYCAERGLGSLKGFDIVGPMGGVHTWWTGRSWSVSGNNSVFYLRNLQCAGFWTTLARLGPEANQYRDLSAELDVLYDYRVRAVRGGQASPWSEVLTILTLLALGVP
ncbi:MAG: hypothetical protein KC613_08205 [Myxococcales bacterium]|nr:hypothetical protein [Myxococcales bacterium]